MPLQKILLSALLVLSLFGCETDAYKATHTEINKTLDRSITALDKASCRDFLKEVSPVLINQISADETCKHIFEDKGRLSITSIVFKFVRGSNGMLNEAKNEYIVDLKPLGLENGAKEFKLIKIQERWYVTQ